MTDPARSFDQAADLYADVRPGYPAAALDWLLPAVMSPHPPPGPELRRLRVLDLGAGTGKLTRLLADRGLDVVAVEPSPQMGAALTAYVPEADLRLGPAEQIPLPDDDVDVVLAGQAFHWFEPVRALPEIARVLRPGGRFGIVRNDYDDSVGWVAALADVTGNPGRASGRGIVVPELPGLFGPGELHDVWHEQQLTPDGLRALVRTHSVFLIRTPDEQARIMTAVDTLLRTDPALAGRDTLGLPYRTQCWRAAVTEARPG